MARSARSCSTLSQRATKQPFGAAFAETLLQSVGEERRCCAAATATPGFMVLLAPDVPAVLLEMGFITNVEDERLLQDPVRPRPR